MHRYKFVDTRLRMQRVESEDFVHQTVTYHQLQNEVLLSHCMLRQIFKDYISGSLLRIILLVCFCGVR